MNARIILCLMAVWACLGCEAAPTPAATPDAASDIAAPKDVAADVPGDVAADVPGDVAADVPVDVAADVPADIAADIAADVPADVPAPVVIGPCDPTGGLAVPTTKRAKMVATFDQPANGYNGPLEAFDGTSDDTSTMSKFVYANIVSWLASEVKGMDDSGSVSITFDMQKPAACMVYSLTSAKAGNNHLTWSHKGKAWRCDGSVMVDTINGKAYQFHFDGQCIGDPESSPPGVGSVHMVGKGSALM